MYTLPITTVTAASHHVNLLYITAGEISHYILVKDFSRLVLRQYNNDDDKRYLYQYWFHGCTSEEVLKNHLGRCKLHGAQRIKHPEADQKKEWDKVKFTKTEYQLCAPFVIYVDFESILRKQDMWTIVFKILHHLILASCTMWKLHLCETQGWTILLTTSSEYKRWCYWKVFRPCPSRCSHL